MARETDMIYVFAVDPTVNDDIFNGYTVGNDWKNSVTGEVFTCTDATNGAAVWNSVTDSITGEVNTIAGTIIIEPSAALNDTVVVNPTDNYNPAGFEVGGVIKKSFLLVTHTGALVLTGLIAPSPVIGNRITIFNNSTSNLTLSQSNANSLAANRFLSNANVILQDYESVDLIYSTLLSRWIIISQ